MEDRGTGDRERGVLVDPVGARDLAAERSRRGKRHAAHQGEVSVLSGAPYGYRYIGKHIGGGVARYEVQADEARIVRQIFQWIGRERISIGEVCRRLRAQGCPTRSGKLAWDRSTVAGILKNPAYAGAAAFGKTRVGPLPARLRPVRGAPSSPAAPMASTTWPRRRGSACRSHP